MRVEALPRVFNSSQVTQYSQCRCKKCWSASQRCCSRELWQSIVTSHISLDAQKRLVSEQQWPVRLSAARGLADLLLIVLLLLESVILCGYCAGDSCSILFIVLIRQCNYLGSPQEPRKSGTLTVQWKF